MSPTATLLHWCLAIPGFLTLAMTWQRSRPFGVVGRRALALEDGRGVDGCGRFAVGDERGVSGCRRLPVEDERDGRLRLEDERDEGDEGWVGDDVDMVGLIGVRGGVVMLLG